MIAGGDRTQRRKAAKFERDPKVRQAPIPRRARVRCSPTTAFVSRRTFAPSRLCVTPLPPNLWLGT